RKVQLGPTGPWQETKVAPTGKKELEGGKQVTAPQAPEVTGSEYLTTAPHCELLEETVMFGEQVMVHGAPAAVTSVAVLAELLAGFGSFTLLAPEAVLVMMVPSGVAKSTFTTTVNVAVTPASRSALSVHVIVPVPPTGGVTQFQPAGATT